MKANAPRPLVMVTFNGQVEYVNGAFLATLGWSRDAVISVAASSLLRTLLRRNAAKSRRHDDSSEKKNPTPETANGNRLSLPAMYARGDLT
jgi:PAS domain-containing protein